MGGKNLGADIKQLSDQLSEMKKEIDAFRESLTKVTDTSINSDVSVLTAKLDKIERHLEKNDSAFHKLKNNFEKLSDRLIYMESQSRRDNLILEGIPEAPPNSKETDKDCLQKVREILENKLKIDNAKNIRIARCHRLGPLPLPGRSKKPRSVIFKLHWFGDRQIIWQSKRKLKGTDLFLKEDFPKEIVSRRNTLYPIMLAAQKHDCTSYLVVDKLHIIDNNKKHSVYDVNSLDGLPAFCDPKYVTTKKSDDTMVFFHAPCPLSNFYECTLTVEGQDYQSSEQFFQFKKAELANDALAMNKIMRAETAAECKFIGDSVQIQPGVWHKHNVAIMKQALQAKFLQNDHLKDYLVCTGNLHLGEASARDRFWGIGVGLGSKEVLRRQHWRGKNTLGDLLMELRSTFT